MEALVNKLKHNQFAKSILLLVSGTGFAHLLTFAALPFLTRFYTPEQFSQLGVFVAIVTIIASAACFRYEIAIPLPKSRKNAVALVKLSFSICALVSALLLLATWVFTESAQSLIKLNETALLFLPLAVFGLASYNIMQYWFTREKAFSIVAKTKVTQSITSNSAQLLGGVLSWPMGLIIGQMFNYFAGLFSMLLRFIKQNGALYNSITLNQVRFNSKRYKHYPCFSTPEVLANNAGIHLPIILIAAMMVGPEAGYLFLAIKVMQIPMMLMGASISQVYFSEVANKDDLQIKEITEKTLITLINLGVAPLILIGGIAENSFIIAFGSDWERAGQLVLLLTPWFILQFLSSPISMIMHVKFKQKQMLMLTSLGMALRVGGILLVAFFGLDLFSESLAVSSAAFYLLCIFIFSYTAKVSWLKVVTKLKVALILSLTAVMVSGLINSGLERLL